MNYSCIGIVAFFLTVFISRWFKIYSTYLAGNRRDKIGSFIEHKICDIANSLVGDRVLYFGCNIFLLANYLNNSKSIKNIILPLELNVDDVIKYGNMLLPLVIVFQVVLAIELRLACLRIIDLDVEERKQKLEKEKIEKMRRGK